MKCVSAANWDTCEVCLHLEPKLRSWISEETAIESSVDHGFRKILLEAVDEGLSLLGDLPKQALYAHLERAFSLKRQDLPYRIEEFAKAIEEIFGQGAKLLEIEIMKELYKRVGHNSVFFPDKNELVFTEYVEAVSR